jgi:hypothetical protein
MSSLIFDIETGPVPQEQLLALYREPTFEEFSAECDQRWKPETRLSKWEEAKANGWQKFVDRAALSPLTGQVLAVGIKGELQTIILGLDGEPECEILDSFWQLVRKCRTENRKLIGFNSNGFDLPFLRRRSWWHSVATPESLLDTTGRYFSSVVFTDLMAVWGIGNNGRDYVSLDTLARWFGIGGKPDGVDGAAFAGLWNGTPEERQQAIEYLNNDLALTWQIAERMGVIL